MIRDDMKPYTATTHFERSLPETQVILRRAATRGAANMTPEAFADVNRHGQTDWLMVPTKRGTFQVVVTSERAFRL